MAVDFDQDLYAQVAGFLCQLSNKIKGFRDHETTGSGFLNRIPDSVESYHLDACRLKLPKNRIQIRFRPGMANVDVHLFRIERGPKQFPLARSQCDRTER